MSNPKAVLARMAALSVGLNSNDNIYVVGISVLVCIGLAFIVNALYSLLFSIGGMMRGYQRCRRWVDGIAAGVFTVAGVGMIRSAFVRST
jgi:threonine efflux protein